MKNIIKYLSVLFLISAAPLIAIKPKHRIEKTQQQSIVSPQKLGNIAMQQPIVVSSKLGDVGIYYQDNKKIVMQQPIVVSSKLGNVGIYYRDGQWHVINEEADHLIQNCFVPPVLRKISEEALEKFFDANCYISIEQFTNGGFHLKAHGRLLGGGVGGWLAGAYAGKFITHFVCHGAILIAGACTGPAAPATIAALEATFLPAIEAASTVVALSCGIIGGAATGPV